MPTSVLELIREDVEAPQRRLAEENLSLAYLATRRLCAHPADYEETLSDAMYGLVVAARQFDWDAGNRPSTFLYHRIRGAILDGRRDRDHLTRVQRKRKNQVAAARHRVEQRELRRATDHEIAQELGVEVGQVWRWESARAGSEWVSLDRRVGGDDDSAYLFEIVRDTKVGDAIQRLQAQSLLVWGLEGLDAREREILGLYHVDGFKMIEIADHFGVTESRISQIMTKAREKMLSAIGDVLTRRVLRMAG